MHQATRPVTQAQTCALLIRKQGMPTTQPQNAVKAAHEDVLATGRGPLTNGVTGLLPLQQFPGFLSIFEQHLHLRKEDFLQAFLHFSLENTE